MDFTITTKRLLLRSMKLDDVDAIHQLWNKPKVRKYLWDDQIIPKNQAIDLVKDSIVSFQDNKFGLWGVFFREETQLIGFSGFWYFHESPQLELLFGIAPNYWGQGLAAEVAKAMIKYGFECLGFQRIMASADRENTASLRVMEKAGMKLERTEYNNNVETVYYSLDLDSFLVKSKT